MIRAVLSKVVLAMTLFMVVSLSAADSQTDEAVSIGERWVQLVDAAQYDESWNQTSAFFRSVITSEQWAEAASGVRDPLGILVSRTLTSAAYTTSLPNAPTGEYVVITYSTEFANRASKTETVTVMIDDDQWKVTGYFVK